MGKLFYKQQIYERLREKPHMEPLFTSVFGIPERLREYDPNLFVVRNTRKKKYEIHSLANKGNTHCMDVPFNALDARIEEMIRKGWLANRGEEIFREIDEANERLKRSKERDHKNRLEDIAAEMQPAFAQAGWDSSTSKSIW